MELQEIVNRSVSEKYIYPDVFTDDCGLDSVIPGESLHAIPSWGWSNDENNSYDGGGRGARTFPVIVCLGKRFSSIW